MLSVMSKLTSLMRSSEVGLRENPLVLCLENIAIFGCSRGDLKGKSNAERESGRFIQFLILTHH